jgi:hypothetical protein
VLKSDPEIKQGPYNAFFRRKTLIVSGHYKNNIKTGSWFFYNPAGKLIEKYNYDKHAFIYEGPLYEAQYLSYLFDDTLRMGDRVMRPLKAGGPYYGYIPYLNLFQVPFNMVDLDTNDFTANVELLISPLGRLADYSVRLTSDYNDYDYVFKLDVNLFSDEDRSFAPATVNGKAVMSRIIVKCFVTDQGGLDFDRD